jgi:hypothetical protein
MAVNLGPGSYEIRVSQINPSQPAEELNVDSRGFTVR